MSDLIDRQQAVDALTEYGNGRAVYISVQEAVRRIEQLPSAQPEQPTEVQDIQYLDEYLHPIVSPEHWSVYSELYDMVSMLQSSQPEQRWIPCSERLPEDSQFVLMTIRRMDKHYSHEPFISVGYISWNQSVWWCAHDGDCKSHDVRVDAWMPLPEPYKEGDTNG